MKISLLTPILLTALASSSNAWAKQSTTQGFTQSFNGLNRLAFLEASTWEVDPNAEPPPKPDATRRFALIVGANQGGQERVTLRYAGTDATSLVDVLHELGGVNRNDRTILLEPNTEELLSTFKDLSKTLKKAKRSGERVEVVFYYSGHSDEKGLLLGSEVFRYDRLRQELKKLPADVRIGILDSCASGAFTRLKGGIKRAPFLAGSNTDVTGHAFLTSSSADEAAQESDQIQGSYFTHYLVTGLRGAADINQDRLVTLNEAYRFAYDETLARTQSSRGGAQHAAYDIELAGSGDLVMTDLRDASASLVMTTEIGGRVYVRDAKGTLIAELYKLKNLGPLELALEPGAYMITVDDGQQLWEAQVTVKEKQQAELGPDKLRVRLAEATRLRGGDAPAPTPVPPANSNPEQTAQPSATQPPSETPGQKPEDDGVKYIPFNIGLFPGVDLNSAAGKHVKVKNNFSANLIHADADQIEGAQVSLGYATADTMVRGMQAAIGATNNHGELEGLQGAIGVNLTHGKVEGVQAAIGGNFAFDDVDGIQASVGFNYANRNVRGIQATTGINWVRGQMMGIQAADGVNVAMTSMRGLQASSGVNFAKRMDGVQAGIVNVSRSMNGAQFGLVNVTSRQIKGLQLGLVNYAEEADASIGLITPTKKGGTWGNFWTSDVAALNLAVKFRAKYTYSLITLGLHPLGAGKAWMYGLGFGGHIPFKNNMYMDIDGIHYGVHYGFKEVREPDQLTTLRFMFGWKPLKRFGIWAGPTLNLLLHDGLSNPNQKRPGLQLPDWRDTNINETTDQTGHHAYYTEFAFWPGFVGGIEF